MSGISTAMVVWHPPVIDVDAMPIVFQCGAKVIISHKDPCFDGAIGQVEKYISQLDKYVVRIPSDRCATLCHRSTDCVKACTDGRHKGWCKTDSKRMTKGVGTVVFLSSNLKLANDMDMFCPVITETEDDTSSSSGDKHVEVPIVATPVPDAEPSEPNVFSNKRKHGDTFQESKEKMNSEKLSNSLYEFMISELGFSEAFSETTSKRVAEQAIEGMHFQPYVRKRYM